ncbi:hypothetical protein COV18_02145 [Candidatus Woesearchaeota archaeon CG10_big_fil_rev_8_21_14_0_10_37_12]|nr:MAG: hypothetical protein COV18_02145 [Candidatus Woesearchaeota archaeon CG10_big_fil_rev_8_21_14_0_10_37_12]
MKVLILCPDWFPNVSGFTISCYQFAKELAKRANEVTIVVPKTKELKKKNLSIIQVPVITRILGRTPFVWGLYNLIRNRLKDVDVILLYSYMFDMNVRVAFYKWIGLIKNPVVLMYRGSLEPEIKKSLSFPLRVAKTVYDNTLAWFLFKHVDLIISNSGPTIELIEKKYGVNKKRIKYIKNALYVEKFKVREKLNKRVVFVGRLVENKGVNLFKDILGAIPSDWEFLVVGDGPLMGFVEGLSLKFNNLKLIGRVDENKVHEYLSNSDVLVLPSFGEGSPRVVLEASASGLPSVAFDVGDVSNIIPLNTGFVIENFNVDKFCSKLKFLTSHPEKITQFGKKARSFAEKELDWSVVYEKMMLELRGLVKA